MTGFIDFKQYLESFNSSEKYIRWLEEQLMDTVRNPNQEFMEQNLSTVTDRTRPICVGVSYHIKVSK